MFSIAVFKTCEPFNSLGFSFKDIHDCVNITLSPLNYNEAKMCDFIKKINVNKSNFGTH